MKTFKLGTKFIPVVSSIDGRYLAENGKIKFFATAQEAWEELASYPMFRPAHEKGFVGRLKGKYVVCFSSIYYDPTRASIEYTSVTSIPC